MSDPLPKIWNTPSRIDSRNGRFIDFHINRPQIDYVNEVERHDPVSPDHAPDFIFFSLRDLKSSYKQKLPDLMSIISGILVVSQKLHDLLLQFNLGATSMFEVPLYEYDQKTPRPGTWYILHIAVKKQTVIPERSENVRESPTKGYWDPSANQDDVLAVHAGSAVGEDLWVDPYFYDRTFFSDRLKTAIDTAKKTDGLRIMRLPFRPCIVVG